MPNVNISDKDVTNVILNQHKLEASSLTNLILESSNNSLRTDTTNILQRTFSHQKQIFDLMSQKGWYQVQNASQQDMMTAQQSISNMQSTSV